MKTRFFVVISVVLVVVAAGTTTLHATFLKQERLRLIDQQVREAAVALLDSELGEPRKFQIARVEDIISEELGENRLGKFFVIRNAAGTKLFESSSAKLLPLPEIPQTPQWIGIEEKGKYIRILNLALPKIPDRTLQVGLIIDQTLVSPAYFSASSFTFVVLALGLGLIVAWLLANFLTKPISILANFIEETARDPDVGRRLPTLPADVTRISRSSGGTRDELTKLITSFESLIERVNRSYNISRFWSYQMAHELKTPMAVVEAVVNEGIQDRKLSEEIGNKVLNEVFDASETISSFLSWAEVESSPSPNRQYVVKPSRVLSSISTRLSQVHGERIRIELQEDFPIFGNLHQLEQLLTNLIHNACKYSPPNEPVLVTATSLTITVIDRGRGIPASVLDKLGEPFNRGDRAAVGHKSSGLGLAYVQSVCWLHGWKMKIQTSAEGTRVSISFPGIEEHSEMSDAQPRSKEF